MVSVEREFAKVAGMPMFTDEVRDPIHTFSEYFVIRLSLKSLKANFSIFLRSLENRTCGLVKESIS